MKILGIETSCDETGIAIYDNKNLLICNEIYSQIIIHKNFGGPVPELSSRDHIQKLIPLLLKILKLYSIKIYEIKAIAYTSGPGLSGALMIGASFAKSLGYKLKIPTININHIEGHIFSSFINNKKPTFPFISLIISGGHTMLIKVKKIGIYDIIGETLDDSVGETIDKIAKLLKLEYPGGAKIEQLAKKNINNNYQFPKPLIKIKNLNFSFSGLKTYIKNIINKTQLTKNNVENIAYSLQETIIDTLLIKCFNAIEFTKINTLSIAGGVSINKKLKIKFIKLIKNNKVKIFFPKKNLCTDNGGMISFVGYQKFIRNKIENTNNINIHTKLKI
ncbi:MAG: tRNA (adenosine(37)-N6)-threonylcarbamoyltransferase complex transferase subunit TsaD [Candidatus Azosocius agrarius]|nr:MAG: tRNA (adenosine(37)-N6)-threonylcarbamoyltransferase complex transferase subunit TsaD [Gammaproteobacteria bacterium]